jgi:hypothetical protein
MVKVLRAHERLERDAVEYPEEPAVYEARMAPERRAALALLRCRVTAERLRQLRRLWIRRGLLPPIITGRRPKVDPVADAMKKGREGKGTRMNLLGLRTNRRGEKSIELQDYVLHSAAEIDALIQELAALSSVAFPQEDEDEKDREPNDD